MLLDELYIFSVNSDSPVYRLYSQTADDAARDVAVMGECNRKLIRSVYDAGLKGNVWRLAITLMLVNSENPYSLSCEKGGNAGSELTELALHDVAIIRQLFAMENDISIDRDKDDKGHYSKTIRGEIEKLSEDLFNAKRDKEFLEHLSGFYREYGVGDLGLHKAFRLGDNGRIDPISSIAEVTFDTLIGSEEQKAALRENTEAFLNGKPANNVLLYGEAGTGKSTSIKALTNLYYHKGLRVIEIYKHQFPFLNSIISQIKNREYRFILYMDDLSFEDFETEYKYLKAVIEGGLEERPENILIYATSNRRHLIRETFRDNREFNDDLHSNETKQEKLSLYNRFGITIYFGSPDKREFEDIVLALRDRYGIIRSDEDILAEAHAWEISHGGRSGRTARQFIDYLRGK